MLASHKAPNPVFFFLALKKGVRRFLYELMRCPGNEEGRPNVEGIYIIQAPSGYSHTKSTMYETISLAPLDLSCGKCLGVFRPLYIIYLRTY